MTRNGSAAPAAPDGSHPAGGPSGLVVPDVEQLDLEQQRRVGRNDPARSPAAISHVRRNHQGAPATDAHAHDALVPAPNDSARTKRKTERRAPIERGIKFAAFFVG